MGKTARQHKQKQPEKRSPFQGWERGSLSGRRTPQGDGRAWGAGWEEAGRAPVALWSWGEISQNQSKPLTGSEKKKKKKRLQESLWRCKCPALPGLAAVIPVSWQLPSSFFALLPQSHMEVGLRWVESTTFLLITSKPGDLLWTARGLALLPPSVNCSSSALRPWWCSTAPNKMQTRATVCKSSRRQLGELAVSCWRMGQRKHPHSLFVRGKQTG